MTRSVITFDNVSERPVTFTGRKNVLINGNFDFWQRGTAGTYTSGIWQYLSADRWGCHFDQTPTGAALERSSQTPNSGSSYSIEVKGGTSGGNGNCYLSQRIESNNLRQIRKMNSFTVSGWIKNTGTAGRSVGVNIICPTATDNYTSYTTHGQPFNSCTITGDATISNAGGITLTSNGTWYYFTATCTNPNGLTNFDKGAQLYFNMGGVTATSEQVHYAQIQMEAGTKATEFEHRPHGEELSLCQRYYFNRSASKWLFDLANSDSYRRGTEYYPVTMRGAPSITVSYVGTPGSNRGVQHVSDHHCNPWVDSEASYAYYNNIVGDAEL